MNIKKKQLPKRLREIVDGQVNKYEEKLWLGDEYDRIGLVRSIPTEQSNICYRVKDVICVFIDMKSSTKLSNYWESINTLHEAKQIYTLFTGTATRFLNELGASYIDIKGDGVFGLFDYDQAHRALAAAVSFNTFASTVFNDKVVQTVRNDVDTGSKIGIHQSSLLVGRIGLRKDPRRIDKHNEVWIGNAVNYASKLSSLSKRGEIHVSTEFFANLKKEQTLRSCSCEDGFLGFNTDNRDLWKYVDLFDDDNVPLKSARKTSYSFCKKHGDEACRSLLDADRRSLEFESV